MLKLASQLLASWILSFCDSLSFLKLSGPDAAFLRALEEGGAWVGGLIFLENFVFFFTS